jgi:hypothetical protein
MTSGLHLHPDGAFIAPLPRNLIPSHWEPRIEPSRPVLARTLTWPTTNQFDPTIDEAKQRWGTPAWSSAGEESTLDDSSILVQDESTEAGAIKLRTFYAILLDKRIPRLTVAHVRFIIVPLIWLYAAEYLKIEKPALPRTVRDISWASMRGGVRYFLLIVPLKLLHPPPLFTQFSQPLSDVVVKRMLPVTQYDRIGTLMYIYNKLDDRQPVSDPVTSFMMPWLELLVVRPWFYLHRHPWGYWSAIFPDLVVLAGPISFLLFYAVLSIWNFLLIEVFHGNHLQWAF